MRYLILALCAIGLFVSFRMQSKARQARQGQLDEPSVVQTPRATLFGRIPNSLFGIAYYALLALASFFLTVPAVHVAAIVAAALAALMSVYLAYSLLFVTRMPCVNCWTGHVINWILLVLLLFYRA
jgi:uncharacterized membrane protein